LAVASAIDVAVLDVEAVVAVALEELARLISAEEQEVLLDSEQAADTEVSHLS
jgi:hypothetical protein